MTSEELIAKQQLEIEDFKQRASVNAKIKERLNKMFISVGQPLNDNVLKMNNEQLQYIRKLKDLIDRFYT